MNDIDRYIKSKKKFKSFWCVDDANNCRC